MDEGKETGSELIIANGDSAELLEFEEELFHKMAFLVKPGQSQNLCKQQ